MNIGILNAGGDCPGLNAVIEGAVGAATARGWTVYGFYDGFEGLLSTPDNERWRILTRANCLNIRAQGGTILGTVNQGNFTVKSGVGGRMEIAKEVLDRSRETVERLGLSALIVVGGDGSQTIGMELRKIGLPIVGVPKTIDNDLGATDYTFGFWTAACVVSTNLDRLRTTAYSHQRMMVVEVMGRHAGWIGLYGGISGGADVILIPEIPFTLEDVVRKVELLKALGQREIIVVVSEGATIGGKLITLDEETKGEVRLGGIANFLSTKLETITGIETRYCVLGHVQRGGSPIPFDRVLGVRCGAKAVQLIEEGKFGETVALRGVDMESMPIEDAVRTLHLVDKQSQIVEAAREIGISFGDESLQG
ncbi:MAG: 6-phosphofructokinase [Akkermansia sp.]|nr:ATP-dependent 6-phosphofructokinase [Akkermansia muciniphila]MCI7005120.1 ATP-dependent 6-phosphofructokinase [Akkermansia muciniphila]MDD6813098.1 ATP-dependent 6-phosphofructokinase [Akkermansia muciniphila]